MLEVVVVARWSRLPVGVGLNFLINGRDYLIPMVVEEPSVAETMQRVFAKKVGAGGSWMEGHQAVLAKKAVQDRWSKGIGNVVAREREIKKVQMSQEVGRVMLRSRIPTRQV